MATQQIKINELTAVNTVGANDYLMLHDGNGSCKEIKCSDYQEVTPPPIEWQDYITKDVKIGYPNNGLLYMSDLSEASTHLTNFVGLCIPKFGRIIYPELISLPWGTTVKKCSPSEIETDLTTPTCGLANTQAVYAENANKGSDCAIGYVQNFERFVNSFGIGRGNWYMPNATEYVNIIAPLYKQLKYAASLLGFNWETYNAWLPIDYSAGNAYNCIMHRGNCQAVDKTKLRGVMMMAKMVTKLQPQS